MGTFPITEARQELGFTPSTAVRADIDVRQGDVGAAIGQALLAGAREVQRGSARKAAIELKRQQMIDTRSAITANEFINTAIDENKAFRNINADTKTWSKDLQERLTRAESQIGILDMSDDTRLLINTKFQAASQGALNDSLIAETNREANDTRDAVIRDVIEAVRSGTDQDKTDAVQRFSQVSSDLWDDNEAKFILSAAIKAGQEGRHKDTVNSYRNRAALDPKGIAEEIRLEKELRKEGKGIISKLILTNQDIETILDYTETVQDQEVDEAHQEYWQDLQNDNLDILQTKIDLNKRLPITGDGGKNWWTKLIKARQKEIDTGARVITNGKVRGDLLTEVYNISIGAVSKTVFQEKLLNARYIAKTLGETDFGSLWKTSETEFKSWRGAQLQKSLRAIRAQVVTIDESTMERMIGILRGEALEELTTRRQGEEDKYAEAVKEMDDWLIANPEPTRDEFYKQQRRLLRDYRNKTAEQIRQGRAEFKEIQTDQPTEEQLRVQAAATNNMDERKRIYEQGHRLGYWR